MKTKLLITSLLFIIISNLTAQEETLVLPLGTFHFKFYNNDIVKVAKADQIDILDSKYQKEILTIVEKMAKFKPTIIAIEREPFKQQLYDSLYTSYLKGEHKLNRSEEQQIGFRLAKKLGLKKVHCVDENARYYPDADSILNNRNGEPFKKLMNYFYDNPDSNLREYSSKKNMLKEEGIIAKLKFINSDAELKKQLGYGYLMGIFKYETETNPYFGPDYVSGWWFNRNLRILRNIQKIGAKSEDRVLVVFGAGHMNILNLLFDYSPEFKLVRVKEYLN